MKYSAWNKFHAYYERNKADLYFKIISPRLRWSEVSNFLKSVLTTRMSMGTKTQFATSSWNFQSTTAVCINERRMFMPWKKSVITSVSVFFLPFCKHHWRHLYFNVFWSSPLLPSLRQKPDRTPFARSSFVCRYISKLGLLFGPHCNCAVNVHWSLLWRNVTAYNSRPFQIKVNTTDTRHINSHGGIDSRIKE